MSVGSILITNRKSHTGFRHRHQWPWMTLNCVIALYSLFHRIRYVKVI